MPKPRWKTKGLRLTVLAGAACALFLIVSWILREPPEPEKPRLELTLELARGRWRAGEPIWYRAHMKNLGREPVCLTGGPGVFCDAFWNLQSALQNNYRIKRGTWIELYGPDGKIIRPSFFWGPHGEFLFWESDGTQRHRNRPAGFMERWADGFRLFLKRIHPVLEFAAMEYGLSWLLDRVERKTRKCCLELLPGATVTTTPSIVAPYRQREEYGRITDARIRPTTPADEREAYEKLWKIYSEELAIMGRPGAKLDPYEPLRPIPGFRILDGYGTRKLGRHAIKAVYSTLDGLPPTSADEYLEPYRRKYGKDPTDDFESGVIKEWATKTPEEMRRIEKLRREVEEYNRTQAVHLESNVVKFEVIP